MNRCAVAKPPRRSATATPRDVQRLASEHGTVEHVPANAERAVLVHDGPPLIEQRDKRDESGGREVTVPTTSQSCPDCDPTGSAELMHSPY
jgi:hypothetical protein